MNNTKVIANSINHHDYRLDDYINNEDDTIRSVRFKIFRYFKIFRLGLKYLDILGNIVKSVANSNIFFNSNKSYGSHKNRAFKDESHKGSMDSLNGEEKKDASKEDLEQEEGRMTDDNLSDFEELFENSKEEIGDH